MYHNVFLDQTRTAAALAAGVLLAVLSAAGAQAQGAAACVATLSKEAAKYELAVAKLLGKCEDRKAKSKVSACPDSDANDKISEARAKMESKVTFVCSGLTLADIGWNGLVRHCAGGQRDGLLCTNDADCPGGGTCNTVDRCPVAIDDDLPFGSCDAALTDVASVVNCVACNAEGTAATAVGWAWHHRRPPFDADGDKQVDPAFGLPDPGDKAKAILGCQRTIGKAAGKLFAAVRKSAQKCTANLLKTKVTACPDAKTADKINAAFAKFEAKIADKCPEEVLSATLDPQDILVSMPRVIPPVVPPVFPDLPPYAVPYDHLLPNRAETLSDITEGLLVGLAHASDGYVVPGTIGGNYATAASCGNGEIDAGETCDDGNVISGDACPSDCHVAACTPSGTVTASVHVSAPAGITLGSLNTLVIYPDSKVSIPGSGAAAASRITAGAFITSPNDLNYALKVAQVDPGAITSPAYQVQFDTCQGAPAATAADFACTVQEAGDTSLVEVFGVTCSVSVP